MPTEPMTGSETRSYRALFAIPHLGSVIASMFLARIAQSMTGVALVLFTLIEFDSPVLAGIVTFASVFPGLVISPIAGALLDRHGRVRLIRLDYGVALGAMVLVGTLSAAGLLSPQLLVVIAVISSFTAPFSQTGLRTLFPLMVPHHLWERVNAFDSNGYLVASIVGPALAASLVAFLGPQIAVAAIGIPYGLAALAVLRVPEPPATVASTGRLLRDAFDGLRYVWRNPTLRGLGFSISSLNIAGGIIQVVIPVLIVQRLALPEWVVGVVFAVSGLSGVVSVFIAGRRDSRGREWSMLVYPMLLVAPVMALMLVATTDLALAAPLVGVLAVAASMFLFGLLNGPLDIGLFTIRQRRTDPAWVGRGFAISMAFNFTGFPIGAAAAGFLAEGSPALAVAAAVVACVAAAVFAGLLVPKHDPADQRREPEVLPPAGVLDATEHS